MIVDTNVLIDMVAGTEDVAKHVGAVFARHAANRRLIVNQIIFAELAPRYANQEELEAGLERLGLKMVSLGNADAYRAGAAFREYRRRGGPREAILPDFLIGAQAAVRECPILTRDTQRFESYFPEVELIDPLMVSHD